MSALVRSKGWNDYSAAQARAAATTAERVMAAAEGTTGEVRPPHRVKDEEGGKFPPSKADRAAEAGISDRTQRKLDRLARERPDLLDQVKAGTLSAHKAAVEAGIVKPADPLEIARRVMMARAFAPDNSRVF